VERMFPQAKAAGESRSFIVKVVHVFISFNLICFTWIFFRASTFSQAKQIIYSIVTSRGGVVIKDSSVFANLCFALILLLIIEYGVLRKCNIEDIFKKYGSTKVAFF